MRFIIEKKLSHNSKVTDSEPKWGGINKKKLPRNAYADTGEADKKSSWKYPHHYVVGGGDLDDDGVFTSGDMYLHKGGLNAAWAAAHGARSGQMASNKVISHLKKHRDALGLDNKELVFKTLNEEEQVAYGVVYSPNHIDTDWETMTSDEIQKMAWRFLATRESDKIDIQHNLEECGAIVVESFIARPSDPDFPEGSWVLGVKCPDDVWERIKDGELNAFSFYGITSKYPAKVLVEVAKQIAGLTEESTVDILPFHDHTFIVNLDQKGKIVSGKTDMVLGHYHEIKLSTATEDALDHNHRFVLE